jgi:hypothetical protein
MRPNYLQSVGNKTTGSGSRTNYPDPESRTRNTGFKRVRKRVFRREKSALEDEDRLQEAEEGHDTERSERITGWPCLFRIRLFSILDPGWKKSDLA